MFAPLPKSRVGPCGYSVEQACRIAETIVDGSGLAEAFEWSLTSSIGAPRRLSWRTLLVVFISAGILAKDMLITEVAKVAADLTRLQLVPGSVLYDQLCDGLDKFTAEMQGGRVVSPHDHPLVVDRRTGEVHDCPVGCTGGVSISRERFAAVLLIASAYPSGTKIPSTVFALDSTDFETWARRQSWHKLPDIDTSDGAETETADRVDSAADRVTAQWPLLGADGRARHTWDVDAREGYRSGKNLNKKGCSSGSTCTS